MWCHLGGCARAAAVGLGLATAASAAAQTTGLRVHPGICEASAAVALQEGGFGLRFVVANDEDNRLRAYRGADPPEPGPALDDHLGVPDDQRGKAKGKADIEAAAQLGDRIYWIASHSRNSDGERRPNRHRFFATTVPDAAAGGVPWRPVGRAVSLLDEIRDALDRDGLRLGWAVGHKEDDPALAAERAGLNVEGLAARPDGTSLLIGLRSPLADGRAIVIPFLNPAAAVDGGAEPRLGAPATLALGGRGIRSLEYSTARRAYVIAAGPVDDDRTGSGLRPRFEIYGWSGDSAAAAEPLAGVAAALAAMPGAGDFHPEGMAVSPDGRAVWLFSDDGGYDEGGGQACAKRTDPARQAFRSVVLPLPPP